MITAEEARKRISKLETKHLKREKQTAEEKITQAIERGENSCLLGIWISETTEKWLKSLGYKVEWMNSQKDGINVKVIW